MSTLRPNVLVAFDRAHEIAETFDAISNEVSLHWVTQPDELSASLENYQPDVVFSVKGRGFPGPAHRPVVTFPSVKWVEIGGSGYEHLHPWDRESLLVTNCSGVLSRYLAETVLGALITLNGNFLTYIKQQQDVCWEQHPFRSLSEQSILIVGLGHIGSFVAEYAKAIGMRVLAVRRRPTTHSSVDVMGSMEDLPNLVAEADVVSVHLRSNLETNNLFDAKMFEMMKAGSLFLNTSRGSIVNEQDLVETLKSGQLRGAYLDVFAEEPLPKKSPLWSMPNVLLTPHCADNIVGWHKKLAEHFVSNLERFIRGEALHNVVC